MLVNSSLGCGRGGRVIGFVVRYAFIGLTIPYWTVMSGIHLVTSSNGAPECACIIEIFLTSYAP